MSRRGGTCLPGYAHYLRRLSSFSRLISFDKYGIPKTVTNQLLVLQAMLKTALRWRLIQCNPVADCERPRVDQAEMNAERQKLGKSPCASSPPTRRKAPFPGPFQ